MNKDLHIYNKKYYRSSNEAGLYALDPLRMGFHIL